jgi:predicted methyltransferase
MRSIAKLLVAASLAIIPAVASATPADIAAAVSASGRSADNLKLDESRKPAEVLSFFGLEPGMRVLDLFGSNRYWAEIIAPAVGPTGHVVVWEATQFLNDKGRREFADFAGRQGNVTFLTSPMQTPLIGTDAYDFAILNLNYHDTYWESSEYKIPRMDPDAWLRTLYSAMKPGAVVGVIDHVASTGANPRESVEKFHRIDPAVLRADFERAGFVLEDSSDLLRNPADDYSIDVFNAKVQGKTDRVMFRFRKPA